MNLGNEETVVPSFFAFSTKFFFNELGPEGISDESCNNKPCTSMHSFHSFRVTLEREIFPFSAWAYQKYAIFPTSTTVTVRKLTGDRAIN